jgi:Spy/CpxP family protein refolding chaperone
VTPPARALAVAIALLCGVVGFLLGRGSAPERAERAPTPTPTRPEHTVEIDPAAYAALMEKAARIDKIEAESRRLAEAAEPEEPAAEVPGTRRPDGTIVGGARWKPETRLLALGFLGSEVDRFFAEANLTEHQKQKLRAELENRISEVMQIAADYANAEIDGDQTYDALEKVVASGRAVAAQVLDERQLALYHRFENGIAEFNRTNVVSNELATLRQELGLDREQERLVRPFVEERYRRVQERFNAPLPNMFFKPIRRERDRDIYDETGRAIRELLRPEQQATFDAADAKAATAVYAYRSLLVPK